MSLTAAGSTPRSRLLPAFAALGVSLYLLVFGLLHSALARLDEHRMLRHRMVAERVFDEVEREIGSVLQHEAERPSQAYDAVGTDPARWSPFVVGYYRRAPELTLVAEASLGPERATRLRDALQRTAASLERAKHARQSAGPEPQQRAAVLAPETRVSLDDARGPTSSPAVLRQLNRGVKVREHRMHDFLGSFALARDGQQLVAERDAVSAGRNEGLVIDVPVLIGTVQAWVLGSRGLRELAVLRLAPQQRAPPEGGYRFEHRLAAPFDAYQLTLDLARLDDEDASSTLYGFAGLFGAAAALGLIAIYRMVVVQVGFAERRNNFVAAVTHELRTPLTAIRMYGEMLRDGMVDDEAQKRDYYATITAESERLTRLINNVMEHGRLRRGQRHAHLEHADAGALVHEVVELMRPHIEREGRAVELRVSAELPPVQLERDALKQVLFNVLDNAIKYGRGDTGPSTIELSCAAANGGVLIRARDYGPGVASHQLDHVFEPFYRGEHELTRRHQGTGLGLSLVRDLVELMHGHVEALNCEPGFEIRIQLRG